MTATVAGRIIASGSDLEQVELEVAETLSASTPQPTNEKATHVVSPNGLKGKILSRTAGVWGDAVTVRFDNGQIHSMNVTDRTQFTNEPVQKVASVSPIERLSSELLRTANTGHGKRALVQRLAELKEIRNEVENHFTKGASNSDLHEFHRVALEAEQQMQEVQEGIDHLDATEGEGFTPYKPEQQIIDSPDIGHKNDGTWLDSTLNEMVEEARGVDYENLMDEGPTLFVAEQDSDTLADAGDVRERALSFVRNKTAGVESEKITEYENLFVARVEQLRRVELAGRKHTAKKEATTKKSNVDDAPVESLFL